MRGEDRVDKMFPTEPRKVSAGDGNSPNKRVRECNFWSMFASDLLGVIRQVS